MLKLLFLVSTFSSGGTVILLVFFCTIILGLSVAVAIGLGGVPFGRFILLVDGLGSGRSITTGAEVTGGVSVCDTLIVVVVTGTSVALLPSGTLP